MEQQIAQRMKASDFPKEVLTLFDRYVHGMIDRRAFLEGASKFAAGGMTAVAMLEALSPNYALAQQVQPNDQRIQTEYVTVNSPEGYGTVRCYFTRPATLRGKVPGVLVVHENRGLNPYIEDVARRLAVANFIALAPDGLTSLGGYPGTDERGVEMQRTLDNAKLLQDFISGVRYLREHALCNGLVGATGFCFGGGIVNQLAVKLPYLSAGAPFYGSQPTAPETTRIQAPLLIHYASMDDRINAGWPAFETALKAAEKKYTMHMYENTMHGFHNDTTPRYSEAAAKLAWDRTIAFFNQTLRPAASASR
jgi:carboxymethylenebutenolidase